MRLQGDWCGFVDDHPTAARQAVVDAGLLACVQQQAPAGTHYAASQFQEINFQCIHHLDWIRIRKGCWEHIVRGLGEMSWVKTYNLYPGAGSPCWQSRTPGLYRWIF